MQSSAAGLLQSLITNAPQKYLPTPRTRWSASAVAEAERNKREKNHSAL